jgi:hypothetical protein
MNKTDERKEIFNWFRVAVVCRMFARSKLYSIERISSQSINFSSGKCSLDRSNVDRSKYDLIDRIFKALSKLQQLQKQIREKQKRNIEHKT